MKKIRLISAFFGLLLPATALLCVSASAQSWDRDYEQRAQEALAGLVRLNGLLDWTPNNPASWPEAAPGGQSPFQPERASQAVSWNREGKPPARLTRLTLANSGLKRAVDLSGLSSLTRLEIYGNQIRGLNLDGNSELTELAAMKNQLGGLNLKSCPKLRHLFVSTNHLKTLDLAALPFLQKLSASANQLKTLDISDNPELVDLEIMNNELSGLDVSKAHRLTRLMISHNQIKEMDLSSNQRLIEFNARNNQISDLDLSANKRLQEIVISRNRLSRLDLVNMGDLIRLSAENNLITSLNLSCCLNLKSMELNNNPLKELIIGDNQLSGLQSLNLDGCRLPLSVLAPLSGKAAGRARFGSQETVLFEHLTLAPGQPLDLSGEANLAGAPTHFTALNEKKRRARLDLYNEEGGIITFKSPGRYYVEMSNDKVVSSETNQLTGRVRTFKVKAVTGPIDVAPPEGEAEP